jgi:glycosyltransferase involved in cell wall biosynthesis
MKFCFQGEISGAIRGNTEGGGELQVALLAKALALNGHDVSIVDYECDEDFISKEGIRVISVKTGKHEIRFIGFLFKFIPTYYRAFKAQQADFYYARMRNFIHVVMYLACRKVHGKFILAMASDLDATGFKERYRYFYKQQKFSFWHLCNLILVESIHPYLVRKADIVLSQHEGQQQILEKRHISSFVFRNLFDVSLVPPVPNPAGTGFIYVSTYLNKRKGFVELYKLIEQLPTEQFIIVGKPSDDTAAELCKKLKDFKNVTMLGKVSHNESIVHIANARALVTTSPMEGFPNIFLEAWAVGVPIISLIVDPGDIITQNKLGLVCQGRFDLLCSYVKDFDRFRFDPANLKKYVNDNHSIEFANAKFFTILNS